MKRSIEHMKKPKMVSLLLLFLLISMIPYTVQNCSAAQTIISVNDDGSADYSSIQEAINAANKGNTVYVHSGTYYENIVIEKSINLIGENKETTIIDGNNDELNLIIHISSDNVNVSGFTIKNSKNNYYCSGVIINNSNSTDIYNNNIVETEDGIILWGSSNDNVISKNTIKNISRYAISLESQSNNNQIYHNNFINTTYYGSDKGSNNTWNCSYPYAGNYWDALEDTDLFCGTFQNLSGSDGIYDNIYIVSDTLITDYYPYVSQNGWLNSQPKAITKGPYIAYVNQTITFDGSDSYDIEGSLTYYWDFGDKENGYGEYVTHKYMQSGTYTVALTVTDDYEMTDINTTLVHVWESTEGTCIFNATKNSFVNQKSTEKYNQSPDSLEVSNKYGNTSSDWERYLLITFNLSTIPLITSITKAELYLYYYDYDKHNPSGRTLSIRKVANSWNETTVEWSNYTNNSSGISANSTVPTSFSWMTWDITEDVKDFVSGEEINYGWLITDEEPWNDYDIPVTKFKSKETQTQYAPYLKIQYVTPLLACSNGPYHGKVSKPIQFQGSTLWMGTPPYSWQWSFGDDTSSKVQNPQHTYDKSGNYSVNLTIKDKTGKSSTTCTIATIEYTPLITLTKPENALYINNNKIFSLFNIRVIGPFDIIVNATDSKYGIEKVEFYSGNDLKETCTCEPYIYHWDEDILFGAHYIKVLAYDMSGNYAEKIITIWKLF